MPRALLGPRRTGWGAPFSPGPFSASFASAFSNMATPSSIGLTPNAENRNLEIANLGVLGRPEHRTPVGEKIQEVIFRALRDTKIPNTGCFRAQAFGTPTAAWGTSLGSIFFGGSLEHWNTEHRLRKKFGMRFLGVFGRLEHRTPQN